MRVLVVVPTYNEAENIERMLDRVHDALPEAGILVVDDGSPDGTADLVEKAVDASWATSTCCAGRRSPGLGSAYRAGFRWGLERGYEACVEMDADFSHDPAALPESGGAARRTATRSSIGSRYVPGGSIPNWSWYRHLLSWGGQPLRARSSSGSAVADSTAGFRVYAASVLRRIDLDAVRAEGYGFQIEMTYRSKQAGAGDHARCRSGSSTGWPGSRRCPRRSSSRRSASSPGGLAVCEPGRWRSLSGPCPGADRRRA